MAENQIGRHVHFLTSIEGLDTVRRMLAYAERRAIDLSPVFSTEINEITQDYLEEVFKTDGAAAGAAWKALSFSTRKWKAKHGFSHGKILRRTFEGMYSLIEENENSFIQIRKRTYERGTKLEYMNLQNSGYDLKRWGTHDMKKPIPVPARPWRPRRLPKSVIDKYVAAISNYIVGVRGQGFSIHTPSGLQRFNGQ